MRNSFIQRRTRRILCYSFAIGLMGSTLVGCEDDLLTGTPSWLGESIMGELERRGNFTETIKLIRAQDEDYESVLSKTGSKTVFVADDAEWANFYRNNAWGVKSLDALTESQKKLLFKGNIIDSPYLVEQLGNIPSTGAELPPEGTCMRRRSSVDIMDSVPLVSAVEFPVINPVRIEKNSGKQVDHWQRLRGKSHAYILNSDNPAPIIHFMPKFMQVNNISSSDVEFLTNGQIKSNGDAFINGRVIKEADITAQNGYIHVTNGVPVPLENLATIISNHPDFTIFSRLLNRFSYPHFDEELNTEFQRQRATEDTVYVRRYFNDQQGGYALSQYDANDGGNRVTNVLPYDPARNLYTLYSGGGNITWQQDAAVILVPTDKAMMEYLKGDGSDLQERYATSGPGQTAWDNAPDEVVLPLLRNVMLTSLKAAIPSQFGSINNTAAEPMGVKKADIDSVLWACNGIVYKTNKVYVAPEYLSVFYPAVVRANEDLGLFYTVVSYDNGVAGGEGFQAYMNSMGTKYSLIMPTDKALQTYYDPVTRNRGTVARPTSVAYKFRTNLLGRIAADAYLVDWNKVDDMGRPVIANDIYTTKVPSSSLSPNSENQSDDAFNHFKDIINSSLATSMFTPGRRFYQARNGGPVIVQWNGNRVEGVAGSFQYERGYFIPVTETFDKSNEGNGFTYIVDQEPLMSTTLSPYAALNDTAAYKGVFREFAALLDATPYVMNNDGAGHPTMDRAINLLNNYHYTIYVPTNQSIRALIDSHRLPSVDNILRVRELLADKSIDLSLEEDSLLKAELEKMQTVVNNFVTYHIQDNSVFVEGANYTNQAFETACLDPETERFSKLTVNYNLGGQLTVRDNLQNVRTVSNTTNNILARQYYFCVNKTGSATLQTATQFYTSSFAVLHQIDAPLFPNNHSLYSADDYNKVEEIIAKYTNASGKSVRRYRK